MKNLKAIFIIIPFLIISTSSFALEEMETTEGTARYYAAEALGKIGDKRAVKPLISALKDKDPFVRKYAIEALGKIGDKSAIEPLRESLYDYCLENRLDAAMALEKLGWVPKDRRENLYLNWAKGKWEDIGDIELLILELKDQNGVVRRGAAEILSKISKKGDTRALLALIFALKDGDWAVPIYAAEALGNIGDIQALESLIVALRHKDSRVREKAAEALGKIKNKRTIEPLIEILLKDEDSDVRMYAATALEKLGWEPKNEEEQLSLLLAKEDWSEVKKNKNLIEKLISMVESEKWDRWERREVINILGEIGDSGAVEPLIKLMKKTRNYWEPIIALGKIKDKRAIEPFIELLQDKDLLPGDRMRIAGALGEIGDSRATNHLIDLLNDKDFNVQAYAIKALGKLGDKRAIESLINIFLSPSGRYSLDLGWDIRESAVEALEKLGWEPRDEREERYYLMTKAITKKQVKKEAALITEEYLTEENDILEEIKTKGVVIYFLKDENWGSRERAANLAGRIKIKDNKVIEELIRALGDKNHEVRSKAAWALGEIGDKKAIEPLRGCLKDTFVGGIATQTLVKLKDEKTTEFLLDALEKVKGKGPYGSYIALGIPISCEEIVRLLGEIGDKRAVEPLIQLLKMQPANEYYFSEW